MTRQDLTTGLPPFNNIDAAVKFAHTCLWREYGSEERSDDVPFLVWMLDPSMLAKMLGLTYVPMPEMEVAGIAGHPVAGQLDLGDRSILVSEERGPAVARFTGAHELGHFLCHRENLRWHWEREFDPKTKDPQEQEANHFAARFLMPEGPLVLQLTQSFGQLPIQVDEHWLCFLLGDQTDPDPRELDLEYALAGSRTSADRRQITPLHQQFKVSKKAMAIRLQEVGALAYPATSYRNDF